MSKLAITDPTTVCRTFANRFTTLPVGVVSKNIIGTRMMFFNSLECRMRDALTEELAISRVPRKTKIPVGKADIPLITGVESSKQFHL